MRLYQKIIITFVILNVGAIGSVSYFLITDFQNTLTDNILQETENELKLKSQILEKYLNSNSDSIKLYTILPEIQGLIKFSEFGDSFLFDKGEWFELIKIQFQEIVKTNPNIDQIRVLDKNGMEIIRINSDENNLYVVSENELQDKSDRYYFQDVITQSKNYVYLSDIDLNVENGEIASPHKTTLRFSTLITDGDNTKMGIMVVNHNMDDLLDSIAQISKGSITIVDNNGQVIFSENQSILFGNQLQSGYNYFEEHNSIFELLETDSMLYDQEKENYKFWQKVSSPSDPEKYWIIIANIPQNAINGPIQDATVNSIYFVIGFILATLVITIILSNRISKPLDDLMEGIKQAKTGDYDSQIPIKGSDEIADIGKSFNDFTATLQVLKQMSDRFTDDLDKQLSEVKFMNKALDETAFLMKVDLDGNMTYVNDRFCELSGYEKSELLGQNPRMLKSGIHSSEFYKEMWDTILDGKVWIGDTKNKRKDGSFYWTKKIIIPKNDADGNIVEFLGIQTDITEDKDYESKVDAALQQEKQKRLLENEFTKMTYHDLLDPISALYGNCEILKNTQLGKNFTDEQKEMINELDLGSKKLEQQIEELLSIYKLNNHEIIFKKSTFTVYLLIETIILEYSSKAKDAQITIVNDVDPLFKINSDESYVTQIINNLLQNAFDFVPKDGGVIKIGAKIKDKKIVFNVQDNGAGFSEKEQNNLFKKFYELDTSDKRKHKPYEIRLILCKAIVESLGGEIKVESHPGFGSTFYFQLPFE